jgi:hypothetical protein
MSDTLIGGDNMKQKKIYGKPWSGKKSRAGQFAIIVNSKGDRIMIQVLKLIRNEMDKDRHLVVFGVDENSIYLNFLTPKENNNYDVFTMGNSGGISCGSFIKSVELKDGVYPVERVAPGVYKFDRRGVK